MPEREEERDRGGRSLHNLEIALEGYDVEVREKIFHIVSRSGIDMNDPFFAIMMANAQAAKLIAQAPEQFADEFGNIRSRIDVTFVDGIEKIRQFLPTVREAAIEEQKTAIATSIERIFQLYRAEAHRNHWRSVVLPMAGLLSMTAILGFLLGSVMHLVTAPPLDPTGPRQLTLKQAQLLEWAQSSDGQLAENLLRWNITDIALCLRARDRLQGQCVLWLIPPDQRPNP